ncbi:tetratricopeptide repeat protein [Geomonas sp.]|uniref:tetratricopeptide repeat protein n=1 Tax=Geomonas sp. TaxID=2651584 RepID=UPI002B45F0A7|nr:tetratricopeptide repeat protein [Geomonas sp.]HJV34220.1 tetratricopeptide repeat protein [Geomonas sp.]
MRKSKEGIFQEGMRAGYLLLAIGLSLLAGCATSNTKVVPVVAPVPVVVAPVPTGPTVTHYTDGREGFAISEPGGIDAKLRADFEQANKMVKDGKYDQGIELLEKIIVQAPKLTAPHINVAIAYQRVNKPELAEQHLKKAIELIPNHPVACNEYGLLLRKQGRFDESRKVYEKALGAFPEYYPLHKNLGILCDLYLKDQACAVKHYEAYDKAVPKDQKVKMWLADLRTRLGKDMTASAASQNAAAHP